MPPKKGKKPVPRHSCENITQPESTANSSTIRTSIRAQNNRLKAKENEAIDKDIAVGRIEQLSSDNDNDYNVPKTQFETQFEPQLPQLLLMPLLLRQLPSLLQLSFQPIITEF